MALSSPLTVAQFWGDLCIVQASLTLHEPVEINQTRSGDVITASLGDAVWRGSVVLGREDDPGEAARIEALLALLSRPGMAFLAYDPRKPFPAADPAGRVLGMAEPTIKTLNSNRRELSLANLPAGYVLRAGDLIGWEYGASPTRYGLHRLLEDVIADGSGDTVEFEVTPFIADAVTTSTAVSLIKPVFKAVLDAPPEYGSASAGIFPGAQFSFVQTLR